MDSPVTFFVLIEFEPTIVLICRSTSGVSTSSCSSEKLEVKTSVDWSSRTAYVVDFFSWVRLMGCLYEDNSGT